VPYGADRQRGVEFEPVILVDYFGFDFLCGGCTLQRTVKLCTYFDRCVRAKVSSRYHTCQSMCVYATECALKGKCGVLEKKIIILEEVALDDI
jgi:hypothetical protein